MNELPKMMVDFFSNVWGSNVVNQYALEINCWSFCIIYLLAGFHSIVKWKWLVIFFANQAAFINSAQLSYKSEGMLPCSLLR
jgi:hypothetical protein